jgi:hypothetical protein
MLPLGRKEVQQHNPASGSDGTGERIRLEAKPQARSTGESCRHGAELRLRQFYFKREREAVFHHAHAQPRAAPPGFIW